MRHRGTWLVVAALAGIGLAATVDALRGESEAAPPAARQAETGVEKSTAEDAPAVYEVPAGDDSPSPLAFVDSINSCERLLVTRQEVEAALGFRAEDPAPFKRVAYATLPAAQVESWGGVTVGCEYASRGGQVVISAYTADAPPPLGRAEPVQGIGTEAEFSPFGNGDEHVAGPEGATSILQVRSGDLILRFNGGVLDSAAYRFGYGLPLLQLAEDALTTLDEGTPAGVVPAGYVPDGSRHSLTVEGVPFSFRLPTSWERKGGLYISKSIVGPQGAEAVIFWTSFPDGTYAYPCAHLLLLGEPIGPSAAHLADAVSTARGTELVAGPADVRVGGRAAEHVVLTVREDAGCDPGYFFAWRQVWGGAFWAATEVGDTIRVWIVEVDGKRLVIEAETTKQADLGLEREIQRIVESIRFDKPTAQRE